MKTHAELLRERGARLEEATDKLMEAVGVFQTVVKETSEAFDEFNKSVGIESPEKE